MKLANLLMALVVALVLVPVAGAQDADKPTDTPKKTEDFVYVKLKTTLGDIFVELNNAKAPISTKNFLEYVDAKYYDGLIFHRVIPSFMVQGGGYTPDLDQPKPTRGPIKNEWQNGLKNDRGTVAMARLGNQPDSATSQFFINHKDNDFLNEPRDGAGYAVFAKVVEGMGVVDKIAAVRTRRTDKGMENVPVDSVTIEEARRLTEEETAALKERVKAAAAAQPSAGS